MVIQYKCPNCAADMVFDASTGTLHCGSCDHKENIEATYGEYEDFEQQFHSSTFDGEEVHEYLCNNCAAVILTDKDTTATSCSFCGSPVILTDRLSGILAPTKVIPFSITKADAESAFKKWCKKARLSPKEFTQGSRIKSLTGIYVPFWIYDIKGQGEAMAHCTRVSSYIQGDYRITSTRHYDVYRKVDLTFRQIPADASEKMADDLMDRLEPFDYINIKDFQMPYLAGYLSEKYNYTDKEMFPRIQKRVNSYMDSYIRDSISGYASTTIRDRDYHTGQLKAEYALMPVWMVYYSYDNAEYTFAMNGQTGKIAGYPPISKRKAFAWFSGIAAGSFLLCRIITMLLGGPIL